MKHLPAPPLASVGRGWTRHPALVASAASSGRIPLSAPRCPTSGTARNGTPVPARPYPRRPAGRRAARTARCTCHPERPGVHGIEADVADQLVRGVPGARSSPQYTGGRAACAWPRTRRRELARNGVEGRDDPGLRGFFATAPRPTMCGHGELRVGGVHRQGAGDDDLARQVVCLLQNVVDSRPVHGQQQGVRLLGGLGRRPRPRAPPGLASSRFSFRSLRA